jgi:hypothetical protein
LSEFERFLSEFGGKTRKFERFLGEFGGNLRIFWGFFWGILRDFEDFWVFLANFHMNFQQKYYFYIKITPKSQFSYENTPQNTKNAPVSDHRKGLSGSSLAIAVFNRKNGRK